MRLPAERTLRASAAALSAIGIGIATYIAIADSSGSAPVCLAGGGGCRTVANSSYSHLAGVNVAVFGIVGYVLLLAAALLRGDGAQILGLGLAGAGFAFSVYLTYLELFVIDAICQWCVASAVLMTILFLLNAIRLIGYAGTTSAAASENG